MNFKAVLSRIIGRDPLMRPQRCYSQDGEDLVLDRLLEGQQSGFFVDVGAHHPVRFSNTYLFYRRGWRGINIDAQPGSMKKFRKVRPRDINIECGVAGESGRLLYYRFNEPALNTFEAAEAELKNRPPYKLLDQIEVEVQRLDVLLARHLPAGQSIDFMSVDVEGKDYEVLSSNDWTLYRPTYVLAETLHTDMVDLSSSPIVALMSGVGYRPIAKVYNTTFFKRGDG